MEKRKRWFAEYYLYFVLYSILGWLYEVFLEVVVYRWGFSNRGVLLGPWCVVYGTGALLLIFCLGPLQRRPVRLGRVNLTPALVFVGVVVLTTVLELIASYIMQAITGGWLWDYTSYAFNFQGRIALNPSIRFGLGGMLFLYLLQPLFRRLSAKMPDRLLFAVSGSLAALMLLDTIYTFFLK